MSVITFTRNLFDGSVDGGGDDAGTPRGRTATLLRMLLILLGGLVVTGVAAALVFGVAALIWGGPVGSIVQQLAGD
ncbi:hypothetical protein [Humibacter sp. RRB41]|uniref:hypothetical protein n=1 Tax=Humibacter sp. RRB41 TaxID=2919946 RepID=UPI001FAA4CE8|nr:hypothetical protein [Humibacter sp. RRB41]